MQSAQCKHSGTHMFLKYKVYGFSSSDTLGVVSSSLWWFIFMSSSGPRRGWESDCWTVESKATNERRCLIEDNKHQRGNRVGVSMSDSYAVTLKTMVIRWAHLSESQHVAGQGTWKTARTSGTYMSLNCGLSVSVSVIFAQRDSSHNHIHMYFHECTHTLITARSQICWEQAKIQFTGWFKLGYSDNLERCNFFNTISPTQPTLTKIGLDFH